MHSLVQSEEMKCCQIILLLKSIGILAIGFNGSIIRFQTHTLPRQCGFLCLFHSRFPLKYREVSLFQGALSLSNIFSHFSPEILETQPGEGRVSTNNPDYLSWNPAVSYQQGKHSPSPSRHLKPWPPAFPVHPHTSPVTCSEQPHTLSHLFPSAAQFGFASPVSGMLNTNIFRWNQI